MNTQGAGDPTLTADDLLELEGIAAAADDSTIARTLVVYSDNHGEFMVAANGRFKAAAGSCQPNQLLARLPSQPLPTIPTSGASTSRSHQTWRR
ncbi:MAG: hypothetical protein M9925_13680 [Chloroflexi bacterium]|nr:hypothetical protein [Chloroflexota bacterium]